jgi:hypothetical protein
MSRRPPWRRARTEIRNRDTTDRITNPSLIADQGPLRLDRLDRTAGRGGLGPHIKNGFTERLMRIIREQEIERSEYRDFAEAYGQLGRFLDGVYDRERLHSALGYLTPAESEQQWLRGQKATPLPRAGAVLTASGDLPFRRARSAREDAGAGMIRADSLLSRRAMLRSIRRMARRSPQAPCQE